MAPGSAVTSCRAGRSWGGGAGHQDGRDASDGCEDQERVGVGAQDLSQCGPDEGSDGGGGERWCGEDAVHGPVGGRAPSVGDGGGLDECVDAAGEPQDHPEHDEHPGGRRRQGQRAGRYRDGSQHDDAADSDRGDGREAGVAEASDDLAHAAEAESHGGEVPAQALLDQHGYEVDDHREDGQCGQSVRCRQQHERPAADSCGSLCRRRSGGWGRRPLGASMVGRAPRVVESPPVQGDRDEDQAGQEDEVGAAPADEVLEE
jgi:hypothetical protein